MPALALNGVTVPVALNSWSQVEPERLGDRGRGVTGAQWDSVWKRKFVGKGRLIPRTAAEARAFRGLIEGQGEHWTLDATPWGGRRGTQWVKESTTAGLGAGAAVAPWGNAAEFSTWYYADLASRPEWTILDVGTVVSETRKRWILRSDGVRYDDGALHTTLPYEYFGEFYSVTAGRLRIRGRLLKATATSWPQWSAALAVAAGDRVRQTAGAGLTGLFAVTAGTPGTTGGVEPVWDKTSIGATTADNGLTWAYLGATVHSSADLTFLPFAVPDGWASEVDAELTARPWTAQPYLRATGDLIPGAPRTVTGRVTGVAGVPHMASARREWTGEALEFELREA